MRTKENCKRISQWHKIRESNQTYSYFNIVTAKNIATSIHSLEQRSLTFLAPETSFMEDSFSTDSGQGDGFGMIQVHYIYCALYFYYYIVIYNGIITQLTIMLTGGRAQAVMQAMGSGCKYRWSFTHLPTAHLLLCSLVPNKPWTDTGSWPGGWGPLP